MITLPEATLRVRYGGSGPPLLLLHGHPRTHTTWHRVAPMLSRHFTVVCPDLRGFGQSSKPTDAYDYDSSSKRAKARDCIALMEHLGFPTFNLAGHDRGSYTAFRAAMDHPDRIDKLAILTVCRSWRRSSVVMQSLRRAGGTGSSSLNRTSPSRRSWRTLAWYGGTKEKLGRENFADYLAAINNPETVRGMLGDYRAGLFIDHVHDREDRAAGRKLACPLHLIWSLRDDLTIIYGDVLAVWQPWAQLEVTGRSIDCGHHVAEEAPEELAGALPAFFLSDCRM